MRDIKLKFCGGAGEVTGVNYLLIANGKKILVDCGMFQGSVETEKKNWEPFPYNPKEIDAVFITHAHLDHIGRLPKLCREGFRGKIYATAPTIDLSRISLEDAAHLHKDRARDLGREPFFSADDVGAVFNFWEEVNYHKAVMVGDHIEVEFRNAGHILGSAMVQIKISGKSENQTTIIFTGDLGNWPVPLLPPPDFVSDADYLVIESTYGNRLHEPMSERREKVERAIEEVATNRGTLMIPSFALERTQELLFELNELVENNRVPRIPIFLDSPLTERAIEIYRKYPDFYNRRAASLAHGKDDFFRFPGLKITRTVEESKQINDVPPPKVIIAASGMMVGGRIQHHLRRYLADPQSYLLIITYQAEGTLGREIFEIGYSHQSVGKTTVKIAGEEIPVRCKVRAVGAYSSHADQAQLRSFIEHIQKPASPEHQEGLKKVFIVQGEEKAAYALSQLIKDHIGIEAYIPKFEEEVQLSN